LLTNLKLPELAKGHAEGQDQHGIPKRAGLAVEMPVRQPYTYQIEIYSAVIVPIAKTAGENCISRFFSGHVEQNWAPSSPLHRPESLYLRGELGVRETLHTVSMIHDPGSFDFSASHHGISVGRIPFEMAIRNLAARPKSRRLKRNHAI
jgi:hypothetical protein